MNKFLLILMLLVLAMGVIGAGCVPKEEEENVTEEEEEELPGVEWCEAGTSWSWAGTVENATVPATADFKIIGIEEFKGEQYCHAHWTYEEEEEVIGEYDCYFIEKDGKVVDMWLLVEVRGQKFEYHYTGR